MLHSISSITKLYVWFIRQNMKDLAFRWLRRCEPDARLLVLTAKQSRKLVKTHYYLFPNLILSSSLRRSILPGHLSDPHLSPEDLPLLITIRGTKHTNRPSQYIEV